MTRPSSPFVNLSAISQREDGSTKSPPPSGPRARPLPCGPRIFKPSKLSMSNMLDEDDSQIPHHDYIPRKMSEPFLMNTRTQGVYDESLGECSTGNAVQRSTTYHPGRPRGMSHASTLLSRTLTAASPPALQPMGMVTNGAASYQTYSYRPPSPPRRLSRSSRLCTKTSSVVYQKVPLIQRRKRGRGCQNSPSCVSLGKYGQRAT